MTSGEEFTKLDDPQSPAERTHVREATSLIAFTLPSTPDSVHVARFYIRAALKYHQLGDYAEDALIVTSELVTNAIRHAGAGQFGVEVTQHAGSGAVAIIVTDPSRRPPIKRCPAEDTEHGRGLQIVDALSASWGWRPQDPGKAVYAILAKHIEHLADGDTDDVAKELVRRSYDGQDGRHGTGSAAGGRGIASRTRTAWQRRARNRSLPPAR